MQDYDNELQIERALIVSFGWPLLAAILLWDKLKGQQ